VRVWTFNVQSDVKDVRDFNFQRSVGDCTKIRAPTSNAYFIPMPGPTTIRLCDLMQRTSLQALKFIDAKAGEGLNAKHEATKMHVERVRIEMKIECCSVRDIGLRVFN